MDRRIESLLGDVLALAGEEPDAVREGGRVALAKCEAILRLQEPQPWSRSNARPLADATGKDRGGERLAG
jgi:hypothetical protein